MYAKPDSTPMKSRIARAGDAMDAALKSLSYQSDSHGFDRNGINGQGLNGMRNDDRPGVIGTVGTLLGAAGINIADMDVGQSPDGHAALMVLATTTSTPAEVQDQLRDAAGITSVHAIDLG